MHFVKFISSKSNLHYMIEDNENAMAYLCESANLSWILIL